MGPVVTNSLIYLAIAEEALAEAKRLLDAGRRPKPGGGYILSHDPKQHSFRQSLIAIIFAGMYLDARLSLHGRARWGKAFYDEKIDRRFIYEEKLRLLGIVDQHDLDNCRRFRETRNDVTHEKGLELEVEVEVPRRKKPKRTIQKKEIRMAQDEAAFGVEFVKSIVNKLELRP